MKINFSEINSNDFQILNRNLPEVGDVILIIPSFIKHSWEQNELHLRSILCNPDGKIISSGFPKFRNLGERPDLDLIVQRTILEGKAWFTSKMDGSLLIRSVIDGKVHFRTRGSHTLGEGFLEPIMRLIQEKYPKLLDPNLDSRYSILFEYTSPENKIVIDYADEKLTVLGLMDLSAFPPEFLGSPSLIKDLEETYGTPGVQFHNLSGDLKQITEQIKSWKGAEGIVVWSQLDNGQLHLTKIKAEEYIRIHSLKFQLTNEKVQQLCWYKNLNTLEALKNEFFRLGVDWEAVSFILPIFEQYCQRKNEITEKVQTFLEEIDRREISKLESRKDKALAIQELVGEERRLFSIGIDYVLNPDLQKIRDGIDAWILDISTKALQNFRRQAVELAEFAEKKR